MTSNRARISLFVVGAIFLASLPGSSVVLRHDRDLARTLELARSHRYVGAAGAASGTLIRPRWVLTAAHVAEGFSPFDFRVEFEGRSFDVERVCVHPGEIEMPWDRRAHDVALLYLEQPVSGIEPAPLYRGEDELGRHAVIAGVGFFGTPSTGPTERDGRRRAVTNRIVDLDAHWLRTVFSRPPGGTELEGVSSPGDSGGPLLIEVDGATRVAGVGSYSEFIDAEGDEGSYGTMEFYVRVSSYVGWIDETIAAVESGETSGCEGPSRPEKVHSAEEGFPATPVGRSAEAYFLAFNSGDPEAYRAFTLEHRSAASVTSTSMEERLEGYRASWADWGVLRPVAFAMVGDELFVLVEARPGRMVFGFRTVPEPPFELSTISVSY